MSGENQKVTKPLNSPNITKAGANSPAGKPNVRLNHGLRASHAITANALNIVAALIAIIFG
ncbi:MAG: hypothetical protein WCQ44_08205, partial [Opitutaceae bacterium]